MATLEEIVDAAWATEIQPGLTAAQILAAWLEYEALIAIVDAVWLEEIQPGLTAAEILAAWLAYLAGESGSRPGRNGWDDWDRIQRRDEAYSAIAAWKQQLRDARRLPDDGQQVPADGRSGADSPPPGGHAAIDIDARIRAQQERRALAAEADPLQPTAAMTGNGLLLAAMLALLEDEDT